jgi:hypothetical protein
MTTRWLDHAPRLHLPRLARWCLYALALLAPGSFAVFVVIGAFRLIRQELARRGNPA